MKKITFSLLAALITTAALAQGETPEPLTIEAFTTSVAGPFGIGAMSPNPVDGNSFFRLVSGNKIVSYTYKNPNSETTL